MAIEVVIVGKDAPAQVAEVSGRDNLKTMAVLEACVRSAADGALGRCGIQIAFAN